MSKFIPPPSHFFTEIDAILDTRLGTLAKMGRSIALEVLKGNYLDRVHDCFPGVDNKLFKETYDKRDKETIALSMATPVMKIMGEFCLDTIQGNNSSPFVKQPVITINEYPYVLTDKERNLILTAAKIRTKNLAEIKFVNMSPAQITPRFLKKDVSIFAIYDYITWLDTQAENKVFSKESCPTVVMLTPFMPASINKNGEELSKVEFKLEEWQKHMEMLARPFIDLQLISPKAFSADIGKPATKETPKQG